MKEIAEELGIPFWDYMGAPDFQKREYYKDFAHLNDEGARKFTNEIIHRLSSKYEQGKNPSIN